MKKLSLQEIITERDKYEIYSRDWMDYEMKKREFLSENKPSTNETILAFYEIELRDLPMGYSSIVDYDIFRENLNNLTPVYNKRNIFEYANGTFRHPIPYIVLRYENKYFFILRESGSGETRLIGKKGLVGGHVGNEKLTSNLNTITYGLLRELEEEVGVTPDMIKEQTLQGVIRSNESVDQDHLGLIYEIELTTDKIKAEEEGILSGLWIEAKDLEQHKDSFENWSRIVYENILKGRVK